MRLLIVCPAYPPAQAGEAEHCRQIAMRLSQLGDNVTVLTNAHSAPAPAPGFQLRATMRGWTWMALPRLLLELWRCRPQAVLVIYTSWMYDSHPMITFVADIARWLRGDVRVLTLFEVYATPKMQSLTSRVGRKIAQWLSRDPETDYQLGTLLSSRNRLAVLGPSIADALEAHGRGVAMRAMLIPPPPLLAAPAATPERVRGAVRTEIGASDSTLVCAFFGFVYEGKGVDTLLRALASLRQQNRAVMLLMVGGGRGAAGEAGRHDSYEREMRALASSLHLEDCVVWRQGYAGAGQEAASDLAAADIAVLPFDDGAELRRSTIAVAAAQGLPVVTTIPKSAEQAFVDRKNVLLVPPRSPEALSRAICQIADDVELRRRLHLGSLALCEQWFSWEQATRRIRSCLQ